MNGYERIVEIYLPVIINGYKTKYFVSDKGNVINGITNHKLVTRVTNRGYEQVHLSNNGKSFHKSIHQLVANAFIPNPENKPVPNHIIGGSEGQLINTVENLEWNTYSENYFHAVKNRLVTNIGSGCRLAIINEDIAHKICEMLTEGYSVKSISEKLNVRKSIIHHILYKQSWKQISNQYDFTKIDISNAHEKKISDEDVFNILKLHDEGFTNKEIIKKLNLNTTQEHIHDICSGRRRGKLFKKYHNTIKQGSTTIKSIDDDYYMIDIH